MPPESNPFNGELDIDNDMADTGSGEDQEFDTLDDAIDALEDDDALTDEQTDLDEGDLSDDDDQSNDDLSDDDETDANEDFEDGDDVLVVLGDGEQVNLGELKKGYFRTKDYTHKTEALAQERKATETEREAYTQNATGLQTAYQNLTQFLENLVPPEPNLALAQTDPGAYQYQTAIRNNAIAELQKVYAGREDADAKIKEASVQDIARYKSAEETKLLAVMPALKDPARKTAFEAANKKTALEFGFSEDEIGVTADHRILQLVHFARIGKIAQQNRKNAGRRVSEKPRKGRRPAPGTARQPKNRQAMTRLAKSGSLEDAMSVDFD